MDNKLFYQTGIYSFGVYFFSLIFLIVVFYKPATKENKFSFRQETLFEVSLVTPSTSKDVKQNKKNTTKSSKSKTTSSKKEGSSTHKRGLNLSSLFSNVTGEVVTEKYELSSTKSTDISRKQGEQRKQISSTLSSIEKNLEQVKIPASYSSSASYNEYYSKINKLITEEFNKNINIKGAFESIVMVTIDSNGVFKYKVGKPSYNDLFDARLEEFLQAMSQKPFPPYKKGKTTIRVIFKTEE